MPFSRLKGVAETSQSMVSADIFNIRMYLKQEKRSVERGCLTCCKNYEKKLLPTQNFTEVVQSSVELLTAEKRFSIWWPSAISNYLLKHPYLVI